MTRVLLAGVVALMAVVAVAFAAPADAAPASPVTRVIIVPGQSVAGQSLSPFYVGLVDDLERRGHPTTLLPLRGDDLRGDARTIAGEIDRTHRAHPGDRIALVTHSIGGISARWALKELGAGEDVAAYVAIGTAQYGSPPSCTADIARENCPGTPFLQTLNAGDDTPGPTEYYGVRSSREYATGDLDGGQCRVTPIPADESLPALGLEHTVEPLDRRVWDVVAAALAGRCRGEFVNDPDGVLTAQNSLTRYAPR
ncbi:MAG: lipase [Gordonia sp. (in: high G+C Gram-positive bacteria)]